MLQNAYFLAKIGADSAENEQHFAEIIGSRQELFVHATYRHAWKRARLYDGQPAARIQQAIQAARWVPIENWIVSVV